jgi:hypothetical protein
VQGPQAWEQSGKLDPVGYSSIPSSSLAASYTYCTLPEDHTNYNTLVHHK